MKSSKFKKIIYAAVAAATILSLSACVMPIKEEKNLAAEDAAVMVANAPVVSTQTVIITGKTVNVRSGPGTDFSCIGKASKGKSFAYLSSKKNKNGKLWYKLQFTSAKTGWVSASLSKLVGNQTTTATTAAESTTVTATSPLTTTSHFYGSERITSKTDPSGTTTTTTKAATKKTVVIKGNPVNVRSGAGANYKKIGSTSKGKKYKLLGTKKDSKGKTWYKIQFTSSKTGWVISTLAYIEGEKTSSTPKKTDGKVAYLTFDDGPSVNTIKILDILDQYNVKATFFVVYHSNMKSRYQEIVKRGHTIALHSYTHDYSKIYKSEKGYYNDLNKIHDYVEKTTGVDSKIIRFPGGSSNTVSNKYNKGIMRTLKSSVTKNGYYYHDWNVSSGDATGRNVKVSKLIANVKSGVGKKKVINVLMHDTGKSKRTTVEALPSIIEYLKKKGYSFEALTTESVLIQHKRK